MKSIFALTTFVVASVGAVGVGALTLAGSNTLENLTDDMIATTVVVGSPFCEPNGANTGPYAAVSQITYAGGGSSNGETAMIKGTQSVAPMSRFLSTALCDGGPSNGEGIVIALDGVSIITSVSTGGSATCNGPGDGGSCVGPDGAAPYPTAGLAFDTTVTTRLINGVSEPFTFVSWQDILKVLYFGKIDSGFHASDPEVGVNCNSQLRQTLANNWSELFESPSNCTGCTVLQHVFRRDDNSGTTDIFASLLGFSGPSTTKGTSVTVNSVAYDLGSDPPFCNDPGANTPAGFPGSNENTPNVWTSSGTPVAAAVSNIVPNDDQDLDPIRRPCTEVGRGAHEQVCEPGTFDAINTKVTGTAATGFTYACGATGNGACPAGESCLGGQCWGSWDPLQTQVTNTASGPTYACGASGSGSCPAPETCAAAPNGGGKACWAAVNQGSLGLLVPVITNSNIGNQPGAGQYATATCGGATFVNAPSFKVTGQRAAVYGACPNGDQPSAGVCSVPADITETPPNPNCLATGSTVNPPSILSSQGLSGGGPSPSNVDQRVFNKFIWQNTGTAAAPSWSYALDDSGRPMTGAYARIHTTQTMNNGSVGPGCAYQDSDSQLGCLVQASPCSLAYAGRDSTAIAGPAGLVTVQSLKIKGRPDAVACIQTFQYPYSRKLYLDSVVGFLNASAAEQALALCESQESLINQAVNAEAFAPLPPAGTFVTGQNGQLIDEGVNGGNPFCEDFNEQLICGAAVNNNGCATNSRVVGAAGAGSLPTAQTTCGNGIQEAFEDCDLGLNNGPLPSTCSTTCRFNQ
ncbi:MAG: hypothetical protein ABSC94_25025 [Polyangiaceae bacterium]|jgi:hypothetical protein